MDLSQLLRALGLQQAYQSYQQNIGQPFANVAGPFGRGLLGLDRPEYGEEQAYRTGQAVGNMPAVSAPVGAFKAAMQAPGLLADATQMAKQMGPELAGLLGLTAFHGSPHRFSKFDASKIGTGEGAQAYGHGLYFAESPNVAKQYADELSSKIDVNGRPLFQSNKIVGSTGNSDLDDYLVSNLGNIPAARRNLLSDIRYVRPENREAAKEMQKTLADLRKANVSTTNTGNIYKVDLPDEAVAKMLDWDKPLSQQPNVIKTLQKEYAPSYIAQFMDRPGSDLYKAISGGNGVEDLRASGAAELAKQGIPGIRYLDQGSRGAGAGTSNFVVFPGEERLLRILERNNQPMGLMGVK